MFLTREVVNTRVVSMYKLYITDQQRANNQNIAFVSSEGKDKSYSYR